MPTEQQEIEQLRAALATAQSQRADFRRQLTAEREGRMAAEKIVDEVRARNRKLEAAQSATPQSDTAEARAWAVESEHSGDVRVWEIFDDAEVARLHAANNGGVVHPLYPRALDGAAKREGQAAPVMGGVVSTPGARSGVYTDRKNDTDGSGVVESGSAKEGKGG